MKLLYIAGPFNAGRGRSVETNIRDAEDLAREIVTLYPCVQPVVPHSLSRVLFGVQPEASAYEGTLLLMKRCDAVVLTEKWHESKGATSEREEALRLNLPLFGEHELFSDDSGREPAFFAWLRSVGEQVS